MITRQGRQLYAWWCNNTSGHESQKGLNQDWLTYWPPDSC